MYRTVPLWEHTDEEFARLFDANVRGVANIIRHFVPAMVERRSGVIVNFSSGRGRTVAAGVAPYCATKWAIEGLTRALAEELPEGMAAVTLNPEIIDTGMLRSRWGEQAGEYQAPADWAKTAAPFILKISAKDNGQPLMTPGFRDAL